MTVKELLKREKGKYTNYELHYQEFAKYTPFSFVNSRKLEDMNVISYHYKDSEGICFDLNLKYKGKRKDHTLIIVWERG